MVERATTGTPFSDEITIPIYDSIWVTGQTARVVLPATYYSQAVSFSIIVGPCLMWLLCLASTAMKNSVVRLVGGSVFSLLGALTTMKWVARGVSGNQRLTVSREGIDDSRTGLETIPWENVAKITHISGPRGSPGLMIDLKNAMSARGQGYWLRRFATGWDQQTDTRVMIETASIASQHDAHMVISKLADEARSKG